LKNSIEGKKKISESLFFESVWALVWIGGRVKHALH